MGIQQGNTSRKNPKFLARSPAILPQVTKLGSSEDLQQGFADPSCPGTSQEKGAQGNNLGLTV